MGQTGCESFGVAGGFMSEATVNHVCKDEKQPAICMSSLLPFNTLVSPLQPGYPLHDLLFSQLDNDLLQFLQKDLDEHKKRRVPPPKPVFIESKALEASTLDWKQYTASSAGTSLSQFCLNFTPVATNLIKSLQEGKVDPYLHELPGHLQRVPKTLRSYVEV